MVKVRADGTALDYATYLGGIQLEKGRGLAVTAAGEATVAGFTTSSDFPLQWPYDDTFSGSEAFITRLSRRGSSIRFSTFWGGWFDDRGHAIALLPGNRMVVVGETTSPNLPLINPVDSTSAGIEGLLVACTAPRSLTLIVASTRRAALCRYGCQSGLRSAP
jgi:hypothetical protein